MKVTIVRLQKGFSPMEIRIALETRQDLFVIKSFLERKSVSSMTAEMIAGAINPVLCEDGIPLVELPDAEE